MSFICWTSYCKGPQHSSLLLHWSSFPAWLLLPWFSVLTQALFKNIENTFQWGFLDPSSVYFDLCDSMQMTYLLVSVQICAFSHQIWGVLLPGLFLDFSSIQYRQNLMPGQAYQTLLFQIFYVLKECLCQHCAKQALYSSSWRDATLQEERKRMMLQGHLSLEPFEAMSGWVFCSQ